MTTNISVIAILDDGRAVFGRYINTRVDGMIKVLWKDRGAGYRFFFHPDNVFPKTQDGLNLAFERSAQLRLKEALENGETDLLPTEVAYIAQAVQKPAE